jgi:hypothetical protein
MPATAQAALFFGPGKPFEIRILSHRYPLEKINEAFAASEWHSKETTSTTRAALTP